MSPDRLRTFVAIRMSDEIEAALASLIDDLRRPDDGIKWVARSNLHLTLKFLGPAVERAQVSAIADPLRGLAAATAPFEVIARGVGTFPDQRRPSVIWAGLAGAALPALAAGVEEAGARAGFAHETRRFAPHLTLGRIRAPRGAALLGPRLAELADREFGASRIDTFVLYRSALTPQGSIYDAIEVFRLSGR